MPKQPLKKIDEDESPREQGRVFYQLTKSKYCSGIQCPKALYLKVHKPELETPPDAKRQNIFDQGTQVGVFAQTFYPGGVLVAEDRRNAQGATITTQKLLASNVPAIFEAAFISNETLVRVDILRNNLDGTWDIIEVKSSTGVEENYLHDLSIQLFVLESSGIQVRKTILKHINTQCVFPDFSNLFADIDCTAQVKELLGEVSTKVSSQLTVLGNPKEPSTKIGLQCDDPYPCSFTDHCWKDIPDHSVFELTGVWGKNKFELYEKGIVRIADIPDGQKVSRSKPEQIQATKAGKSIIDKGRLKTFLAQVESPVSYLDFETWNPAIPKFEGMRPYQHIPFQFSIHTQKEGDARLEQVSFLHLEQTDPRKQIAKALLNALGERGTIVAYHASFEKGVIKKLAQDVPELAVQLEALLNRFVDLEEVFLKFYFDPRFRGSTSIKKTLPILVPHMTYNGLEVGDGGAAQKAFGVAINPKTSAEEKERIRKHLLLYCEQDTRAMVEIHNVLKKTI